ncbi:hypothetical protein [Methanosarcina siciliae]|uniref:hypothetical protein n=1 Tax=Methanosarcina siciliae TaxID=38027 RepID=UPI000B178D6E|nr:hypothetical protein [Methanosarcina siciliae]
MNRYSYALNNPVKYTDPSGHYIETAIDVAFLAMDINNIRTGNANKWTYIGLGVDLVCAALPVATGGRLAVTAVEETVTHADNVGDLFKLLDKTADAEKKVDNAIDAGQTVNKADGVASKEVIKSISNYGFKDQKSLTSHYNKHVIQGNEFGDITIDEYLKGAQNLVSSDAGGNILTKTRSNGDSLYYNKASNEFAVLSQEGTIKTYFKPEAGENYFRNQQ